ncbi:putative feruloyl esterase B-2 [Fusarium oxysporum f. sp. albedinis]|nr:putative feruloyl esterase B-2 [Fusarium oxysporum f. sp. albedinis]
MLAPAQRLIQLKVHLMPYKTESKVPKKAAFFTYDIPENGEGVPLGSPSEDGCFLDGWYYYRAFVVDERMAVHEQFLL